MSKKIGIIGLGSIGMRHAKNLIGLGHEVFGCDLDSKRCGLLVKAGGLLMEKHDGDEHIDISQCDGVIVSSPTKDHAKHIKQCLSPGRAVFAEKPIANEKFDFLTDVAMVGYNLRFHSSVIKAKAMLDDGEIGTPHWGEFIVAQSCLRPPYLRDGVILNWSHEIDLALYLLGPAKVLISSTRLTEGLDDISDVMLEHESGCRSFVHMDYLGKPERRDFTVFGATGKLQANLTLPRAVTLHRSDRAHPTIKYTPGNFDLDYFDEMKAFIDVIDGKPARGAKAEDGLRVLDICLEVRKQAGLS